MCEYCKSLCKLCNILREKSLYLCIVNNKYDIFKIERIIQFVYNAIFFYLNFSKKKYLALFEIKIQTI